MAIQNRLRIISNPLHQGVCVAHWLTVMQKMHITYPFSAILLKNRNNLYDFNRNLVLSYEYRNCYINII